MLVNVNQYKQVTVPAEFHVIHRINEPTDSRFVYPGQLQEPEQCWGTAHAFQGSGSKGPHEGTQLPVKKHTPMG